mmetsp:Transcript_26346/g.62695  ORF Transcript_26346/g.62695 Transcript_26346/m.62695 type:complete len:109 (-) Transcript_26346:380-706(-)
MSPRPFTEKKRLQPETMEPYWNGRGVAINHWYHVNTLLDAKRDTGFIQRDETPLEFGGNTPSGGKFAVPWDMHGWTADSDHDGPSGFKVKPFSYYDSQEKEKKTKKKE